MNRGLLVTILILLAARVDACSDYAVFSSVLEDGTELGLFLNKEIAPTTSWIVGANEPPLSVGKALAIASEWGKKTYTRFDKVEVESVSLQRYGCSMLRDKWYYVVNFR